MKKTAIQPSNTPVITPDQASTFLNTMIAVIQAAQQPDGSNPLVDQIVAATGCQVVTTPVKKPRRHNCCTTVSPRKANGQKKARAADPLRSKEDFQAIGNYLLTHGNQRNRQRNYTLYICGVTLGLRVGDLLNFTIDTVYDVNHNTVRSHAHIINQKNKKTTTDLITPMAAKAINDLVNEIRRTQHGVLDASWPLFQTQKYSHAGGVTRKLSKWQVYRFLTEAAEACGVEGHISTHTMRKTYGATAVNLLGHSGISTTQINETLQAKYKHDSQTTTMQYIGLQQAQIDATALGIDAALSD